MSSVIGMGLAQPPVQLANTINSITQKYIVPVLGDNTFRPSPVFWALTREGKKFGGGELVFPEITQEETPGGAYWGDQLLATDVVDSVQPANQVWRFYRQPVVIPITDIILNRGGNGNGLDIVKVKYQVASASFLQKLSRALWDTAPQNTALDIDSVIDWVESTTNTIAGINRSTAANSWFLPATAIPAGGLALSSAIVEPGYQSVVYAYDEPDIFVMDNTRYAGFKNNFVSNIRYGQNMQDSDALQVGFRNHFLFNNAMVVPDRFASANKAYLMNSRYIFPVFHEGDYFSVDPFMKPTNQRVLVSCMYLGWQLSCISPRMNVAFTGIA